MNQRKLSIDLAKLGIFLLKRAWLLILCAAVGFGFMYYRASRGANTFTASGTMYVYNANPNLVNYGYTNVNDLNSAVQLVDTYAQVVKSNRVLQAVAERMITDYPGIQPEMIGSSLSMVSVSETGVVRVISRTVNAQLSADIVNTVLDVAPNEIKRVVGAGDIQIVDYATVPQNPDDRRIIRQGMIGALAGAVLAGAVLVLLFLLNQRVKDSKELQDHYTLPILSEVKRQGGKEKDPSRFLMSDGSDMDTVESYAKLRMNLLYTMVGKKRKSVLVTSAVSGEGKSTIAANLAVSLGMSGKKVLLVDADMRRGCQHDIFRYPSQTSGLSEVLSGQMEWNKVLLTRDLGMSPAAEAKPSGKKKKAPVRNMLDILPAGAVPPNPSELLESSAMHKLLKEMEAKYDLILLDVPPINIVSDPLALSGETAGGIFVVRQNFSDHREVRKALISSEMTGLELLGFVLYGEKVRQARYYSRKHYGGYQSYDKYNPRNQYSTSFRNDRTRE